MQISSLLIYLFILISTTYFALKSQRRMQDGSIVFIKGYFRIAFIIHWISIAFTRVGADHDQYVKIIEGDALVYFSQGMEVGFNGLCVLLYFLTGNAEICIFVIKTITIILFYYSFYLLRNNCNLGLVVLAYGVWEYFSSIYIIAHALAIALIMLGAVYILLDKKVALPIFLAIIAYSVHASALVLFVVFVAIILINKLNINIGGGFVVMSIAIMIVILRSMDYIFQTATSQIESFEQYSIGETTPDGGGFFNYFLFLLIFVVLIIPILKSNLPDKFRNASFVFFVFSTISAIMGYYLPTARLNQYSLVLYAAIIPWYLYEARYYKKNNKFKETMAVRRSFWILYLLFVGFGALRNATDPQSTSLLSNYQLYNPF